MYSLTVFPGSNGKATVEISPFIPTNCGLRYCAIWGAFAGATLPAGLYVVRLLKGASPYFPTLWIVASLSAIAGAGVGAIVYRLLRRALARDGSVPNPLLSEGMPNDILSPSRAHDRAL